MAGVKTPSFESLGTSNSLAHALRSRTQQTHQVSLEQAWPKWARISHRMDLLGVCSIDVDALHFTEVRLRVHGYSLPFPFLCLKSLSKTAVIFSPCLRRKEREQKVCSYLCRLAVRTAVWLWRSYVEWFHRYSYHGDI
jgi:hypothetical protein